eukprot:scaffold24841_cov15-Tisochrysis_lutea.AAC.1
MLGHTQHATRKDSTVSISTDSESHQLKAQLGATKLMRVVSHPSRLPSRPPVGSLSSSLPPPNAPLLGLISHPISDSSPLCPSRMTRTEFNRSRNSKEVFLPPVFKQQGADMMTARNNHEQAMEGLRLTYVAARRQQQQAALREIAARRKDLQSRSLQPLVTQ